ncbi:MAG TPA: ABC transporter permease subunit [Chloroflexota bacterium]|nr:ABC transporter permease subunit [Chloroflexota bacterium]
MSVSMATPGEGAAARQRRRSARLREYLVGYSLISPAVLLLVVLIVYPALKSIWDTLTTVLVQSPTGLVQVSHSPSLEIYRQLFINADYRLDRKAVVFTIEVTIITLIVLFAICYPLAMYLRFGKGRLPAFFRTLSLIPLFIPTIISAYAFISFYQQGNFLDVLLQNLHLEQTMFGGRYPQLIDNRTGIVMAEVWNNIPITVLLLGAGLGEIDNSLIESARDVGAGLWRIFAGILFPLTLRQFLVAFILAFIGVMGSYNIPALLGPTLPQMLGPAMNDNISQQRLIIAEAEAVLTFAIAAVVGLLYVVAVVRQRQR